MYAIVVALVVTTIVACGPGGDRCAVEGRFLKMNQSEFYVYSLDGTIPSVDTVHVRGGRFDYEIECHKEGILVFVFPNFTELPVFVEPNASVSIKADATHIKDIEVSGTKLNDMMTEWRKDMLDDDPNGSAFTSSTTARKYAADFIQRAPTSIISRWLLYKYFITDPNVPRAQLVDLVTFMQKEDPESEVINMLKQKIVAYHKVQEGNLLPSFTAKDINGRTVSSSELMTGDAVITVWATWNYEGQNYNRALKSKMEDAELTAKPKVISICLDPSVEETRTTLRRDTLPWPVINDQKMLQSPLAQTLGITTIPDNIIVRNGRIIARHIDIDETRKMLFGK